ncbi:sulfatase family protein [Niabella aurantiaca]|uniref:sulfatase family protein n=1 Tax=Niabella aurantiaca TaxID=379900 RepID=UPI0003607093|nr:sulfatase [Niabella aurantiaca]
MIRYTLLIFTICITAGQIQAQQQSRKGGKPNVIIINMDDMGYGDTDPYGATGYTTPNFDRLANEGMRFTHFHAAQGVCSPSRAALLTGCYPSRISMGGGAIMPWNNRALNPAEETIASLLKKNGYATCMLGKWHLGNKAPFFPIHYGFDYFYGLPYSNDMWPVDYKGRPVTDTSDMRHRFPPLPVLEGDKQVGTIRTLEDQSALTTVLTQKAVQFIEKAKNKPFFLYLAHPMPHAPIAVSAKFKGKTEAGLFGDVISEIDWSVGQVMEVLERTGLAKNTLLIVTSDNGPWLCFGNNAGSSGGLREGKGTAWDGGTRVPCFIRWPGKVAAGSICNQLLTNMDILPTVMAATGSVLPEKKIDGLNFLPLLTGKSPVTPREVFYVYFDVNNLKLIRYKNWELVLPHKSRTYQVPHGKDGDRGPTPVVDVPMALYDLVHDPGTVYDVQDQYPEIKEKMLQYAEEARADLGDNITHRKGRNVRPAAVVPH